MLVLSRKQGERIVIGNGLIEITVVEIRGNRIRLGVEAPQAVPILRGELEQADDHDREAELSDAV